MPFTPGNGIHFSGLAIDINQGGASSAIHDAVARSVQSKVLAYDSVFPRLRAPFPGAGDYVWAVRFWNEQAKHVADLNTAIASADATIDAINAATEAKIDALWRSEQFDATTKRCLAAGAQIAAATGALGTAIAPGIGTLIGAVGGFFVGVVECLIPFDKIDFLAQWGKLLDQLDTVTRYWLAKSFRHLSDYARNKESLAVWGPWRIGDDGGLAGHSIWQGVDVLVIFMAEIMIEKGFVPDSIAGERGVKEFAEAFACMNHADSQHVRDMRHNYGVATAGTGSPAFDAWLVADKDITCGEIRRRAIAAGEADVANLAVTDGVREAVLTAYNAMVAGIQPAPGSGR